MGRPASKPLTHKQRLFAPEYVRTNGNATEAAKRAGYSPKSAHELGSRALKKVEVRAEIMRLTRKHEISADRALTRLDNLSFKAEEANELSVAVKCEELIAKSQGCFVDRSVNLNIDASGAHLEALRALLARRNGGGNDSGQDGSSSP